MSEEMIWFLVFLSFVVGIFIGYSTAVGVENIDSLIKGHKAVVVEDYPFDLDCQVPCTNIEGRTSDNRTFFDTNWSCYDSCVKNK